MKRIAILGNCGAGKSTLARALGAKLGLPVVHLDAVFWRPGWVESDKAQFDQAVLDLTGGDAWVMDGNYSRTLDARLEAADMIVFLDFPRLLCVWRVVKRRFQYAGKSRPDMAPGCPEKVEMEFLRWIWGYPQRGRPRALLAVQQGRDAGKAVVHLRRPRDVRRFLEDLPQGCNLLGGGVSQSVEP